jgi:aryl-alcohol dehydrogenase-like predicted oxidoreductase
MKKRKLGFTDLHLTTIGLGTWAIGGDGWSHGWGPQDDVDSIQTIHKALDLGINWIDTAAAYGLGHAEEIICRALAERREEVIIATKCGIVWQEGSRDVSFKLKAESVRREVEASLRRLGVETIDLYQVHYPIPDEDLEEGWAAMADLIKEGKVRYAGISNNSIEQLKRIQEIHPVASVQPEYSMLKREPEKELLAYCAGNGIGVVAYSPLRSGILTDQFSQERLDSLAENDWRQRNPDFQEPRAAINLAFVENLRVLAAGENLSPSAMAIAWVLAQPEVTSAIVGARHPSQIGKSAPADQTQLSPEVLAEIDAQLAEREENLAEIEVSTAVS